MPNIGLPELVIVIVLALLIFGPKRLPEVGRQMGRTIREFRHATSTVRDQLGVDEIKEHVDDIKTDLGVDQIKSDVAAIKSDLSLNLNEPTGGEAAPAAPSPPEQPLSGEVVAEGGDGPAGATTG